MNGRERRIAGQLADTIARQLRTVVRVEPLDVRAVLLEDVRRLLETLASMLVGRAPGEGFRLIVLARELDATHRELAAQCEGELRRRARAPLAAGGRS